MSCKWYVLRSKPNKEDFLGELVQAHQVEIFYPAIRAKQLHPRSRKTKPYFPGYLFVRADLSTVSASFWLWLPGSRGLVLFEGAPGAVPDELINSIRRKVGEINGMGSEPFVASKREDMLTLQTDPCIEYEAIFNGCVTGNDRIRVLLHHLRDMWRSEILAAG